MAMFFHTKQKSRKNSKRQAKTKLPRLLTIDAQVKDFFPFKIRPDTAKTNTSTKTSTKCEESSITLTSSLITMSTATASKLTETNREASLNSRASTQKVTTKPKHRERFPETPIVSGEAVIKHQKIPKSEYFRRLRTPDFKKYSPESQRQTPERKMLYKHYAPYYEEFCKKNLPRSMTNVR